ncbi:hypothetical protein HCN44_006841 [Aphidius gifuensis]|uniref:Uncharacterized protein n=1 Tax=Aphidius gifuensis TaxID=684658 RepID=A0A835CU40_APHGI|nr:hypothetical protein HCN44_006841 [Aphidius gifuensis]
MTMSIKTALVIFAIAVCVIYVEAGKFKRDADGGDSGSSGDSDEKKGGILGNIPIAGTPAEGIIKFVKKIIDWILGNL